jgi:hypothetical protein
LHGRIHAKRPEYLSKEHAFCQKNPEMGRNSVKTGCWRRRFDPADEAVILEALSGVPFRTKGPCCGDHSGFSNLAVQKITRGGFLPATGTIHNQCFSGAEKAATGRKTAEYPRWERRMFHWPIKRRNQKNPAIG